MGHVHHVEVRYGECDQQGVVFNANYLAYVDDAMDHWMRAVVGPSWVDSWDVMLKAATVSWHAPARWRDRLRIESGVCRVGRTSFDVVHRISAGERDVADVVVTYVSVGVEDQRPVQVPAEVVSALGSLVDRPGSLPPL